MANSLPVTATKTADSAAAASNLDVLRGIVTSIDAKVNTFERTTDRSVSTKKIRYGCQRLGFNHACAISFNGVHWLSTARRTPQYVQSLVLYVLAYFYLRA